jgi:hypothetical protein
MLGDTGYEERAPASQQQPNGSRATQDFTLKLTQQPNLTLFSCSVTLYLQAHSSHAG